MNEGLVVVAKTHVDCSKWKHRTFVDFGLAGQLGQTMGRFNEQCALMCSHHDVLMTRWVAGNCVLIPQLQPAVFDAISGQPLTQRADLTGSGQGVHIKGHADRAHVCVPADKHRFSAPAFLYLWGRIHVFQVLEEKACISCVPL